MRDLSAGPRVLLKRLRELMAEPLEPQDRLDQIVRQIAQNMVAEVCSVYVLRSDGILELYATEGLNPGAVHLAQLKMGQGLVGTIAASAQPLNLSDAQSHPAFRYLPETGEEIYHSFLGVPILRTGRALGVLVVQNKASRTYREDEVEALETTAMVLAEMVATGELRKLTKSGLELDLSRPVTIDGASFGEGIGLGYVVLHEPRIVVTNLLNEDSEHELGRLAEALGGLRISIDDMLSRRDVPDEGEHREVLETYRMFAHDRGWVRKLEEAIRNGLTAEAAVERVQSEMKARMIRLTDPYLRERMHDFDDLANRLLRQLTGYGAKLSASSFPNDAIVVARAMGAAELLDYPRESVRGLVLEEGAVTSHVVIVARAMGIPVVGQAVGAVALAENNDAIIIDGDEAKVHLRPVQDLQRSYEEKVRLRARRQAQYRALVAVEPVTKDGKQINLQMNAGLLVDLPHLAESGALGIGLFRTELQFMIASTMPKAEEQESLLSQRAEAGRRAAGDVSHARHRRRQGGSLLPQHRRGKSRARLAGDPAVAGSPGPAAHAVAGHVAGDCRQRVAADAADGDGSRRTARGARLAAEGDRAAIEDRRAIAEEAAVRRHAGGTGTALAARRAYGGSRFRLRRLE